MTMLFIKCVVHNTNILVKVNGLLMGLVHTITYLYTITYTNNVQLHSYIQ